MRSILFAVAAAALFALPVTASAGQAGTTTDISSQSIQIGPGGVRVGHDRWDSRRRDGRRDERVIIRRGHDRWDSRRRDRRDRDCRTVTVRERIPGGGTRTIRRREC